MRPHRAAALAVALSLGLRPTGALGQTPAPRPSASLEPVVTSLTIFAGTKETLWRTKDWGSTWERVSGLPSTAGLAPLSDVRAIHPSGPRVYAGGVGGVCTSDDFGVTWTRFAEGNTVLAILPSRYPQSDATVFLGTTRGLLKTLDGGKTFQATAIQGAPVRRIEWPGPALVVATDGGVLVSPDAGETALPPGRGWPDAGEVRGLVVSSYFQVDPVIFAGLEGRGVYRSSDGGKTWLSAGLPGRDVNDLAWLGPILYAATNAGLQRSEDLGETWVPLKEGPGGRVNRLLFPLLPDSGAVVFAATDGGVFRSEDGGLNWRFSGMKDEDVLSIATFAAAERITPSRPRK